MRLAIARLWEVGKNQKPLIELEMRLERKARLKDAIRTAHQHTRKTCGSERLQSDLADYKHSSRRESHQAHP